VGGFACQYLRHMYKNVHITVTCSTDDVALAQTWADTVIDFTQQHSMEMMETDFDVVLNAGCSYSCRECI